MQKNIGTSLILPLTPEFIERRIYLIRGQKVMLDRDLAELYQIKTGNLVRAVKRNRGRFPEDFMFQLTSKESVNLRFQIGISSWGGRRYLPYVFTELGVAMLSSVLKSERAVQMNIFIVRAFVKLREMLSTHKDLADKLDKLEMEQNRQGKHLVAITSALKRMMDEKHEDDKKPKKAIGFNK